MSQPSNLLYTAARIARALDKIPRSVRRELAGSPADGTVSVNGQSADAWSFSALPVSIQAELERAAQRGGFRNAHCLLTAPPAPKPQGRKSESVASIFLEAENEFRFLHEAIGAVKKRDDSQNSAEKCYVWLRAFEAYEEKLCEGKPAKKIKRRLISFLYHHARFLVDEQSASPLDALRRNFERKYDEWAKSEGEANAVSDGRKQSGNWRAPELPEEDRDKLIAYSVLNCGGRVAQAWRELLSNGEFSESISSYYLANPSRKSYVPAHVFESVKYEVALLEDIHHGPRQHKLNGAYISRDWSSVGATDWFQADDVTEPVYFKSRDRHGAFTLMRGQVLPMIDLRSTCILGFVLLSTRSYNANSIRSLITNVCNEHGLPRKGFYFENGSWRAKILKGDVNSGPMTWGETEQGLREFGLRFVHARLPRAKPIERVIGAMQNLMEGLPGYVGRNEQIEKFERVQKLKRDAERGDREAMDHFMDEEQWTDALEGICDRYNAEPQNGKMTGGLSPNDAFNTFRNISDPPVKFASECRYLLAHHRRPLVVGRNGIMLRFGKQVFNFRNEQTGKLRGQMVLAWFDPENPEILAVTDMQRQNAFSIARSHDVPAMDCQDGSLSAEMAVIAEHQEFAKSRYRVLKSKHAVKFRRMIADPKTLALGAQMEKQREELQVRGREASTRRRNIDRLAREVGRAPGSYGYSPQDEEGLIMMKEALQSSGQKEEA